MKKSFFVNPTTGFLICAIIEAYICFLEETENKCSNIYGVLQMN